MRTTHKILFRDSRCMEALGDESVDLVVTSPPYPMIEMWDGIFTRQNKKIGGALEKKDGTAAFEGMHQELDKVWDELYRVLRKGGVACINIGDATRTLDGHFRLYTNHARILAYMQQIGFSSLPAILWRKQTNAPNKFMGSGMLPPGAYVTLEHEYILILRKGNKREFITDEGKQLRRESAYFWEERNHWFSDVWMDLKGTTQSLFDTATRGRSAAFPFELPYRLINMFSIKGDTVLDPFLGIGTTLYAAVATARNSIGYEIDPGMKEQILSLSAGIVGFANSRIGERLERHMAFIRERVQAKGKLRYTNRHYCFPVVTGQERELLINELMSIDRTEMDSFEVTYADNSPEVIPGWGDCVLTDAEVREKKKRAVSRK